MSSIQSAMKLFREGDLPDVKRFVQRCLLCLSMVDDTGKTPLHHAVMGKNQEVVEYLIGKCGADVNARDNHRVTPFQIACKLSFHEIVSYIEEHLKPSPSTGRFGGMNMRAFRQGLEAHQDSELCQYLEGRQNSESDLEKVKKMLKRTPKYIWYMDRSGLTPLHHAVSGGHLDIVKYLVERCGAHIDAKSHDEGGLGGFTALQIASGDIFKYLMDRSKGIATTN